jgi:hypothetical protein
MNLTRLLRKIDYLIKIVNIITIHQHSCADFSERMGRATSPVIPSRSEESPREAQARSSMSWPFSNESLALTRERLRRAIPRGGSE